jgi:orotidine-5'-phosphate decarboxylase
VTAGSHAQIDQIDEVRGRPPTNYLEKLAARTQRVASVLCLGLDPDPEGLPPGFTRDVRGIEAFAIAVLEAALPFAAAVKPNLAFFEAFGSPGLAALERIRARIPADVPVILDAKRADIGSTSSRHARALFDALDGDAVTVNPYLGRDALAPLLERADRFAYVLCRTSNPGAAELQSLVVEAADDAPREPLWSRMARRAVAWNAVGTVGLVLGATASDELAAARAIAPGLPFLVPGVGAQGGDVAAVLRHGPAIDPPVATRSGRGLLVNVSRGIAFPPRAPGAAVEADAGIAIADAAREWSARLPVLP